LFAVLGPPGWWDVRRRLERVEAEERELDTNEESRWACSEECARRLLSE
jgi:hypothetical protein